MPEGDLVSLKPALVRRVLRASHYLKNHQIKEKLELSGTGRGCLSRVSGCRRLRGAEVPGDSQLSCGGCFFQQCLLLQVSFAEVNACLFCRNWDMKVPMALGKGLGYVRIMPGKCPAPGEAASTVTAREPQKCPLLTSHLHNSH